MHHGIYEIPPFLCYGIPRGFILGALLSTLYIAPLQDVIARHNLISLVYAGETQLYIAIDPPNQGPSLNALFGVLYSPMYIDCFEVTGMIEWGHKSKPPKILGPKTISPPKKPMPNFLAM